MNWKESPMSSLFPIICIIGAIVVFLAFVFYFFTFIPSLIAPSSVATSFLNLMICFHSTNIFLKKLRCIFFQSKHFSHLIFLPISQNLLFLLKYVSWCTVQKANNTSSVTRLTSSRETQIQKFIVLKYRVRAFFASGNYNV